MSADIDARDDQGDGSERIGLSSRGPVSLNGERATEAPSFIEGAGARSLRGGRDRDHCCVARGGSSD
jgi:hypothetical protein